MSARRALPIAAALVAIVGAEAGAQPAAGGLDRLAGSVGLTGSLRLGRWSSTRELDSADPQLGGMAWLKAQRAVGPALAYHVEGWGAWRGPTDAVRGTGELREAYLDLRLGRVDVRAGRQVVAWGRADGINPTDNITPRDLTLLVPDDAERRIGTSGVRATAYAAGLAFSALWFPEFRPHRFALPTPPPYVRFRDDDAHWPSETWGMRVERAGGAVDWSASYLHGLDLAPDLSGVASGSGATIRLEHRPMRVVGMDAAANLGRVGLRAEAAYVDLDDPGGSRAFPKQDFVSAVVGGDRTFVEHLNLNVQYLWRYVPGFRRPPSDASFEAAVARQGAVLNSQMARVQHGLSSRVRYAWLHDLLEAEVASVLHFGPRGQAVLPKVTYAIDDHWKVVAGGEIYRGEGTAQFGMMRRNSVAFAELRLAF